MVRDRSFMHYYNVSIFFYWLQKENIHATEAAVVNSLEKLKGLHLFHRLNFFFAFERFVFPILLLPLFSFLSTIKNREGIFIAAISRRGNGDITVTLFFGSIYTLL